MENVVYVLGAGFSAPAGLPVMSNFLEKSKDLYVRDPEKYAHFKLVFETIREMSFAKNFYATDLSNIEEILSILEMQEHLGGRAREQSFINYIVDVIKHYTPSVQEAPLGSSKAQNIFGGGPLLQYGPFVAALLGVRFARDGSNVGESIGYVAEPASYGNVSYSVVTLNYDLILESIASALADRFGAVRQFSSAAMGASEHESVAYLAKLHGSIATGVITPPTWNKGLAHSEILPAWQLAYRLLSKANHIRILGYSLPIADAYVKYLLRAAAIESEHLKTLDVISLDDGDGTLKQRYREFVDFKNLRMKSARIEEYLGCNPDLNPHTHWDDSGYEQLEIAHTGFFKTPD